MPELMSLREACKQGITLLRRDPWEPWSHLKIDLFEDGTHGPWVTVRTGHDVPPMEGVVDGAFEEKVLFMQLDWDEQIYEPWKPPEA